MNNQTAGLMAPAERRARAAEKRREILRFLRDERWTHTDVIMALLDQKHVQGVARTLKKMAAAGEIVKAEISIAYGRPVAIWGITQHGLAMAYDLNEERQERKPFEPSKVAPSTMQHKIDTQFLKVNALRAGWSNWIDGSLLGRRKADYKIPDAIATDPQGKRCAIEVERHVKSQKRYADILVSHLDSKKVGRWERIIYLAPTSDIAARIQREFQAIRHARYKGQRFEVTDQHRQAFEFSDYALFK